MANTEEGKERTQKHWWTAIKDAKLVECLLDLTTHGWKGNGTFTSGFLNQLEKWLREKAP